MTTKERELTYIRKWRPKARHGDTMAMSNVAAAYRILNNARNTYKWYKRAADYGADHAFLEIGYCLHTGYGVRRNHDIAKKAYRKAIMGKYISEYAKEEAMYLLAVLMLIEGSAKARGKAIALLRKASRDKDYPQALVLLDRLPSEKVIPICLCRRCLRRGLAILRCPLHRRRAG
jgi:TPR repeat protein